MAEAHGPETRSRAIAVFGTSQLLGVAIGGSLSGYVAERLQWRASFWMLGAVGILFSWPLWRFLSKMPYGQPLSTGKEKPRFGSFFGLLRIPSMRIATLFVAVATFGLYLVYTWLPTFLYDKFHLGLARAGFEASVFPQMGTMCGLLVGSILADRYFRRNRAARFWVIVSALLGATPCLVLLGSSSTLVTTRLAAIGFGFFAGFISTNQAAATFDVTPASLRASAVGVLNLLGAIVSGFAPFLGGLARKTMGVGQLMSFTSLVYIVTAATVIYGTLRHFARDHARAVER
jgi:predicted MFS family arabinose efflux permease